MRAGATPGLPPSARREGRYRTSVPALVARLLLWALLAGLLVDLGAIAVAIAITA